MSKFDIVRAWKDAEYLQSLSVEEQKLLPAHPAGSIELADEQLKQIAGEGTYTTECCQSNPWTCSDDSLYMASPDLTMIVSPG